MYTALASLLPVIMVATGSTYTPITANDWSAVLDALTAQISVQSIVGVIAALIGATIGIVFMWWGVRKLISSLMGALRTGRAGA